MRLTFHQLRLLLAVSREGSVSRAAQRLHLTQPTLSTQILEGAPADLFAPADEANMRKLTDANLISGEPKIFTRNELVIVTIS